MMAGKCKYGIRTDDGNVTCKNVTIGILNNTFADYNHTAFIGVYSTGTANVELSDTKIDLSSVVDNMRTFPIQAKGSSTVTINSGTFVCNSYDPNAAGNNPSLENWSIDIYDANATVAIKGGKFSKQPTAGKGTLSIPDGKMFAKMGDFYELVSIGLVGIVESSTACATFEELWNACPDNKQTSVILLNDGKQDQITIPANKNILLSIGLPEQEYNITNNGSVTLNSTLHGSFTNAGAGTLSVIGGTFAETEYNAFVKNNVPTGYGIYLPALNSTESYSVRKDGSFPAKVGNDESGYVAYSKLEDALLASSATYPATVMCNNSDLCKKHSAAKVEDGEKHVVDLNGHTVKVSSGISIENGEVTFKGKGTLECNTSHSMQLFGSDSPSAKEYSVLTIENGVVVKPTHAEAFYAIVVPEGAADKPYGIVVNFNGTYDGGGYYEAVPFYVFGTVVKVGDNMPIFNIGETATITNAHSLAYAAGYGIWNYAGKATVAHHGFEIRAGKLNMTGGSITCTATTPADDQYNGNGSTSQACGIAVCQHNTKLPIEVVVSGGEIKAYTPLYQANPQNNADEIKDVKMTVTGGKFFATSKNVVWALNKRIFLEGGLYNQDPSVYAAADKVAVANTDENTNATYPWTIGEVKTGITFNGTTDADWSEAANWSGNAVATAETPVILNADATISGKAEAYGITVNNGKKITVKAGGVLMVGKNGIRGITSADQLIIEDGGALLISPAATTNNQPLASVIRIVNTYKKAEGSFEEGDSPYARYYMGIPTVGKPTVNSDKKLYARDWAPATGWKDATEFATTFKGYGVTSIETEKNETATFSGQLIGNVDATLSMPRKGFHFFANSWMAPLDMYEVINQLDRLKNKGTVEASVTVCVAEGQYQSITREQLKAGMYPEWEQVKPLQTFFLHANAATSIDLSYEKAAWNIQTAQKQAAPKRMMAAESDKDAVRIKLTAANGRQDNVYIYDGTEFHSTKMMNAVPNVNIYVEGEGNYSTFASEDLEGTMIAIQTNSQTNYSLSFDFVKGETLYIKDLQTNVVTAMTEGNVYNFTATANETSRRFIISRHNTTTTVDNIDVNTAAKGVYSITGQYLGESNIVETLPQGIYVVDGKKVIK